MNASRGNRAIVVQIVLKALVATALLATLGILFSGRPARGAPPVPSVVNSPEDAVRIANTRIALLVKTGSIPEWARAEARDPFPHYGVDGKLLAYAVSIYVGDQERGYMIIGVQPDDAPVLEYSTTSAPYRRGLEQARAMAASWGLSLDEDHPLYLGALSHFYVALPQGKESLSYRVFIDLLDFHSLALDSEGNPIPLPKGSTTSGAIPCCTDAQPPDIGWIASAGLTSVFVPAPVPCYLQFCYGSCYVGCGPTAAGTLMGYWDAHGYPNLLTPK